MAFIRQPARDALMRWREPILAGTVLAWGLWWALTEPALLRWIGVILVILGAGLGTVALQRLRFRQGGGGAGVVQIDEGRLAYFGPLTGGVIDIDDITRLDLDPTGHPPHWVLTGVGGQSLAIPVNAEGADGLFDVFAALPGLRTQRMLDALARTPAARVEIWRTTTRIGLH